MKVDLKGLDDALKAIADLQKKVKRDYLRKANRDACKIAASAVKSATPEVSGVAAGSVKVKAGKRSRNKVYTIVTFGAAMYQGLAYYIAQVLYGHKQGKKELGDSRKDIKGNNFALKKWNESVPAMLSKVKDRLKSLLAGGG